jgi:hypothetical protein
MASRSCDGFFFAAHIRWCHMNIIAPLSLKAFGASSPKRISPLPIA